jgi:hypothetical protein
MKSVRALKSTLTLYCEASGQKINLQKSSVFFGTRCKANVRQEVKGILGVDTEILQDTYLGMPTEISRAATHSFRFLPDRIWKHINGWIRPLSRAGKETLLKSVAQAIPNYVMSCFRIPVGICDRMKNSVADNWWGFENGQKKMHWKPWEWMTAPKSLGGMGFRDFVIFNQAMLGRQCWRVLTEPDSLCARVLKGRYFPNSDFWSAARPRSASYTWRNILFGRELLVKGVRWSIGDGKR